MSDFCDAFNAWDAMTSSDKEAFLAGLVNSELDARGYPPVTVTFEPEPDDDGDGEADYWGHWSEDSNTINFDSSSLGPDGGSASDLVGTAFHEITHVAQDQEPSDPYWDAAYGSDPAVADMFENDAEAQADVWLDAMTEGCNEPEPPESSADGDIPSGW